MSTTPDFVGAYLGLPPTMSLSRSALPDAPVVPPSPRAPLIDWARLTIVAVGRLISRPGPVLADEPAATPG